MILIDFSQIFLSALMAQSQNDPDLLKEDMVRHFILKSIKGHKKKFGNKYGDIILCCDGRNNWRKEYFPFYKFSRKKKKDDGPHNWKEIFRIMEKIKEEIQNIFPYKVLTVEGCEADDIIATISRNTKKETVLIISGDHDFAQLQKQKNIEQYDPRKKKFLKSKNPRKDLMEHIIGGDPGDGIPNILSDDDTFSNEAKRSKPLTKKKKEIWLNDDNLLINPDAVFDTQDLKRNFERNTNLVDLTKTPKELQQKILDEFQKPVIGSKSKIMSYLVKNKLKILYQEIQEF